MSKEPMAEHSRPTTSTNTFSLFKACVNNADHTAFQVHLENNSVPQNTLDKCLLFGFQNVQKKKRKLSHVAPTLKLLLKSGAKWKDGNLMKHQMTPCHIICRSSGDHYEILDLMIASSQHLLIDSRDSSRTTPLMYCVPNANINCMKSLIAKGADVNKENDSYNFPGNSSNWEAMCPVNKSYDRYPRTPILLAMDYGNVECTIKLLRNGARLDSTTRPSSRLFSLAARSVDLLKCILDYGIDKNATNEHGRSILHCAVANGNFDNGNIDAIRYLLELGVTIPTVKPKVYSVEPCSQCGSNRLFLGNQQGSDVYMTAVKVQTPDVLQLLEEYGCQNGKYFNALRLAMTTNNEDMLDYLLNTHQYPVNIEYTTKGIPFGTHQTLLTEACYVSSAKVIKVLLDHGADANRLCGEDCSSVINIAIAYKHVEGVADIIRSGVDVNLKSYDAQHGYVSPFEVAVKRGNLYAAEMLLIFGCSRGMYRSKNHHKYKVNINQEFTNLLSEWDLVEDKVQTLKQQCRRAILGHLSPQTDKKMMNLPLPPILIKFLSIPEFDNIVDECKRIDKNRHQYYNYYNSVHHWAFEPTTLRRSASRV